MKGKHGRAGYGVYRTRRWVALRIQAKRRDGFRCTACNAAGRLEVHHVKPIRERPDLAFDLSNLKCLRPTCHVAVERGRTPNAASIAWRNLVKGNPTCSNP